MIGIESIRYPIKVTLFHSKNSSRTFSIHHHRPTNPLDNGQEAHSHEVGKITRSGIDELFPFVVVVAGRIVEDDEVGKSASTSTSPSTSI
jgi:hypothetical protein